MATDVPVDKVKAMQQQGLDNSRIIDALLKQNYTSTQINEAFNLAMQKPGTPLQDDVPEPQQSQSSDTSHPQTHPSQIPSQGESHAASQGGSQIPSQGTGHLSSQPSYQEHVHDNSYEMSNTEEMVEAIIDEKWNELLRDINKIIDWKNETEAKVIGLEQKFDMLKDQFDKLHQAVVGKVGEYDKHILDVGAEVKAMEKVFSRVLPVFTENVHDLQRITDNMKKKG